MNRDQLLAELKKQTAEVPAGARARVWSRLDEPGLRVAPRGRFVFATAVAFGFVAVAGVFAMRAQTPPPPPARAQTFAGDGFALVTQPGASVTADAAGRFTLAKGGLAASSWAGQLRVTAHGKTIEAEAARFTLEVAGESVVVGVNEGAVLIDGERVEAPHRWPPGSQPSFDDAMVKSQEPPAAQDDRAFRLAEEAASKGEIEPAIERFKSVARHDGLRAEAAMLRQGQLLLWNRHDPSAALEVLSKSAQRFPHGSLAQDAALSRLEALAALKRPELRDEATDFLTRFPDSERRDEVCRLGQLEKCER